MSPTIVDLLAATKTVIGKGRRSVLQGSARLDFRLKSGLDGRFHAFVRVNERLSEHFSIGLRYEADFGHLRVNGDHGAHRNPDGLLITTGPHVHMFRAPARDQAPKDGAEPKWAWPLPPDTVALNVAWRTFRDLASVTSTGDADRKVAAMYAASAQLPFDDL